MKPIEKQRWVRNKQLCEHLGISEMTLWRWMHKQPELKFPTPSIVNGISFHNLDAIDAWLKKRATARSE